MSRSLAGQGARAVADATARRPVAPATGSVAPSRAESGAAALPASALAAARRLLATVLDAPERRDFDVRYWDGSVERGGHGAPRFTFIVRQPAALRRMFLPPNELSIIEAYLSGGVDVDGDLEEAIGLGDAIGVRLSSPRLLLRAIRQALALPRVHRGDGVDVRRARADRSVGAHGKAHDPERDRAAIHYHYDVGNDFYRLWLDRRMVYSCAYFRTPDTSLDDAQEAKLDLVCRKLRLTPGDRLLDIGCGWGALITHAAARYGVRAVGVTLSDEQLALARERIAAAGLGDRCRVELRDYRDVPALGPFDKIASVGMVEHVGVDHLPGYFAAAWSALRPGGLFLNHGIASVEAAHPLPWRDRALGRLWRRGAFIDQYVFPDGKLGPFAAVVAAAGGAGFEVRDVESLREHYTMTIRSWLQRLEAARSTALPAVGAPMFRTWRLYLSASAHSFANGSLNVLQTLLAKPDAGRTDLPLTRDDLLVS
jgi:cyclopropane-fatty-acyl-phospholipid synthase